jgi:hypothetical protein
LAARPTSAIWWRGIEPARTTSGSKGSKKGRSSGPGVATSSAPKSAVRPPAVKMGSLTPCWTGRPSECVGSCARLVTRLCAMPRTAP